jgi:toxin ParE1/3/4
MSVEFHPAALAEVETAQAWYEERSLLAASAFLRELTVAIQRVQQAPQRYPQGDAGTRRVMLERFPFTIYYRAGANTITVVAVAHQKRRPGYWTSR